LNVAHNEIDIFGPKGKEKNAGFTKEERESFGVFLKQGFVDTFRHLNPKLAKYSYWNLRSGARERNQGWRLDYFVTSQSMSQVGVSPSFIDSEINNEYHGSDHCPLSLTIGLGGSSLKNVIES
jgi:exodeoxyribonuclease-3